MKTPVVIGISSIQQKGSFEQLDEALILMEKATQKAIVDSTNPKITDYIDQIQIPKGYWKYRDPGKWIAKRNGIKSAKTTVTKIGVLQQNLINKACKDIANEKINASLIIGGEARYKKIRALIENKDYVETNLNTNPDYYIKAKDDLQTQEERDELGLMAVGYYAILESAYRAQKKLSIQEHKQKIGELYEEFSEIAAKNPDGWLDKKISSSEIIKASKSNPLQALPYNKFHCTSWNVNQASAMIICSEDLANDLGIPQNKRVYPLASSETNHMIAPIQRQNLNKSFGLELAVKFIKDVCEDNNIEPNFNEAVVNKEEPFVQDISSLDKNDSSEEYTPQLFLEENISEEKNEVLEDESKDDSYENQKLFDQDINDEEDFEIPAFLRKQKF